MAIVLVSFIGTGTYKGEDRSGMSKTGYEPVEYEFDDNSKETTTVFGSALLKYLKKTDVVNKWLIMGTPQSIWCDLVGMFGDKEDEIIESADEIGGVWLKLKDEAINDCRNGTRESAISQNDLNFWQVVLSDNLGDTKVICCLVGDATEESSQNKIFSALLENINEGDKVVFDVTHGLRNQPIITSFVVMYLRYLKNITDVKFYYGAKDLDGKVFKLDFCNELLKATEAVAIFEQTGNYEQIGKNLKLPNAFNHNLEKLVFSDEINRTNPVTPQQLSEEISKADFAPLQKSLSDKFKTPLHWASKETLSNRLRHKALFALKRKQYHKAVSLLLEADIVAYGEVCGIPEIANNLETHDARKKAEKEMIGEWDARMRVYTGGVLNNAERQVMLNLKKLRNAIAHGTDAQGIEPEAINAQNALDDENVLKQTFNDGDDLFIKIAKCEIGK